MVAKVLTWKEKWSLLSDRASRAMLSAYERTVLMDELFADQDFRAEHGNPDDFVLAEIFEKVNPDLALTFLELRAVLLAFPRRESWSGKSLRMLYTEARALGKATDDTPAKEPQPRATREQIEELETKFRYQTQRAESLANEAVELRGENVKLRATIQRLEGRIFELERQLKLQPA